MKPIHPVAPRPKWPFTRRQIVAQIIVAAVILGSGIGIGVGGTILSLKDRIMRFSRFDDRRLPPDPNQMINQWRADLSLTDEQVQQIRDVFTKRWAAAREQWVKIAEVQRQEREEFVASMKSILTSEQFTKWQDEFNRHMGHWRPGGPGGPGGPGEHRGEHGPRGMRGPEHSPDGPPSPPPQ